MTDLRSVQYEPTLANVGSEGSEIRAHAQTVLRGVAARIIFRQPDNDEIKQGLHGLGIEDHDVQLITQLPVGCFALIIPDQPPLFGQHHVLPSEEALIQSDSAARGMTNRVNVFDIERYRKRKELVEARSDETNPEPIFAGGEGHDETRIAS